MTGWGTDLDYYDIEWFALEMNQDHYVIFEITAKYCISDSFADYEGYSISSKRFLVLPFADIFSQSGGCFSLFPIYAFL